ncbi:unnamed protein product [Pedinophyceae sp. YPF-701]|nr:unnamed protein product [Pedinophyceae sp. YPF-701]
MVLLSRVPLFNTLKGVLQAIYEGALFLGLERPFSEVVQSLLCIRLPDSYSKRYSLELGPCRRPLQLCVPPDSAPSLAELSFQPLLSALTPRTLLKVYSALLVEQRVLLRAKSYTLLTMAAEGLRVLLHPFAWHHHVYVPVLPASQVELIEAPTPYLMGLDASVPLHGIHTGETLIVDLDAGEIASPGPAPIPGPPPAVAQALITRLHELVRPELCDLDLPKSYATGRVVRLARAPWGPQHDLEVARAFMDLVTDTLRGFEAHVSLDENGSPVVASDFLALREEEGEPLPLLRGLLESQHFLALVHEHWGHIEAFRRRREQLASAAASVGNADPSRIPSRFPSHAVDTSDSGSGITEAPGAGAAAPSAAPSLESNLVEPIVAPTASATTAGPPPPPRVVANDLLQLWNSAAHLGKWQDLQARSTVETVSPLAPAPRWLSPPHGYWYEHLPRISRLAQTGAALSGRRAPKTRRSRRGGELTGPLGTVVEGQPSRGLAAPDRETSLISSHSVGSLASPEGSHGHASAPNTVPGMQMFGLGPIIEHWVSCSSNADQVMHLRALMTAQEPRKPTRVLRELADRARRGQLLQKPVHPTIFPAVEELVASTARAALDTEDWEALYDTMSLGSTLHTVHRPHGTPLGPDADVVGARSSLPGVRRYALARMRHQAPWFREVLWECLFDVGQEFVSSWAGQRADALPPDLLVVNALMLSRWMILVGLTANQACRLITALVKRREVHSRKPSPPASRGSEGEDADGPDMAPDHAVLQKVHDSIAYHEALERARDAIIGAYRCSRHPSRAAQDAQSDVRPASPTSSVSELTSMVLPNATVPTAPTVDLYGAAVSSTRASPAGRGLRGSSFTREAPFSGGSFRNNTRSTLLDLGASERALTPSPTAAQAERGGKHRRGESHSWMIDEEILMPGDMQKLENELGMSNDPRDFSGRPQNGPILGWEGGSLDTEVGFEWTVSCVPSAHSQAVVSLDAKNNHVVSCGGDQLVKLWAASEGGILEPASRLDGGASRISTVRLAPEGSCAVGGAQDGSLLVWDTGSASRRVRLVGHSGSITCLHCSWSGIHVLSGSEDCTARFWDSRTSQGLMATLRCHRAPVTDARLHMTTTTAVTVSRDNSVAVWDLRRPDDPRMVLRGHTDAVTHVELLEGPAGLSAATGSRDGTVRIWDLNSGVEKAQLAGGGGPVSAMSACPLETQWVVVAGFSTASHQSIRFWGQPKQARDAEEDVAKEEWPCIHASSSPGVDPAAEPHICFAAARPHWAVTANAGNFATVWVVPGPDMPPQGQVVADAAHLANVTCAAFDPEPGLLVTGGSNGALYSWTVVAQDDADDNDALPDSSTSTESSLY